MFNRQQIRFAQIQSAGMILASPLFAVGLISCSTSNGIGVSPEQGSTSAAQSELRLYYDNDPTLVDPTDAAIAYAISEGFSTSAEIQEFLQGLGIPIAPEDLTLDEADLLGATNFDGDSQAGTAEDAAIAFAISQGSTELTQIETFVNQVLVPAGVASMITLEGDEPIPGPTSTPFPDEIPTPTPEPTITPTPEPTITPTPPMGPVITWISDTDGDWNEPTNWDLGRIPDVNDTVVIDRPAADVTVTLSGLGTTRINNLQSTENITIIDGPVLQLEGGTSLITGTLQLGGDVRISPIGSEVLFRAEGPLILGDNVGFEARDGARLELPTLTTVEMETAFNLEFSSRDENSVIDLPAFTRWIASGDDPSFEALNQGTILANVLTTLDGVDLFVGDNSLIEFPLLSSLTTPTGSILIQVNGGGQLILPAIETLALDVRFSISDPNTVVQLPSLTEWISTSSSQIEASDGATLIADALVRTAGVSLISSGSELEFPILSTYETAIPEDNLNLEVDVGGLISLPSLQTLSLDTSSVSILVERPATDDTPSRVNLPALTSWTDDGDQFDTSSLAVRNGGVFTAPNLATTSGLGLESRNGSVLELPGLTNYSQGSIANIQVINQSQLILQNLGTLDVTRLGIEISGTGSLVNFPALTSWTSQNDSLVEVMEEGTFQAELLTTATNVIFDNQGGTLIGPFAP